MSWAIRFLTSSVGKKQIMAITKKRTRYLPHRYLVLSLLFLGEMAGTFIKRGLKKKIKNGIGFVKQKI